MSRSKQAAAASAPEKKSERGHGVAHPNRPRVSSAGSERARQGKQQGKARPYMLPCVRRCERRRYWIRRQARRTTIGIDLHTTCLKLHFLDYPALETKKPKCSSSRCVSCLKLVPSFRKRRSAVQFRHPRARHFCPGARAIYVALSPTTALYDGHGRISDMFIKQRSPSGASLFW